MQYGTSRSRVVRFPCEIVTYDSKIVFGYVRELRAARAFPNAHTSGALVDGKCNRVGPARRPPQSNPGGVRNAPSRDQDVASMCCSPERRAR